MLRDPTAERFAQVTHEQNKHEGNYELVLDGDVNIPVIVGVFLRLGCKVEVQGKRLQITSPTETASILAGS